MIEAIQCHIEGLTADGESIPEEPAGAKEPFAVISKLVVSV